MSCRHSDLPPCICKPDFIFAQYNTCTPRLLLRPSHLSSGQDCIKASDLSQPCADKAMQCDQSHQLPVVLHWEEGNLPWRPLHLLHLNRLDANKATAAGTLYNVC